MRVRATWLATLAALAAAAPQARAQAQALQPPVPEVVTVGEGIVRRAPDRAIILVTTETRARAPQDAQRENAKRMTSVQEKLLSGGIPKEAIRTIGYSVEPEYDFTDGRRTLRGFVARNTIEVRVDELARLGEALDVAIAAGATSAGNVRFDLKDRAAVEREALRLAVVDAQARAEAAAAGAGRSIARVVRIQEEGSEPFPAPRPMAMAAREAASPDTPIVAGEIEVRARVTLTAALK
ncbi:MAG: SIMPL domain-containing protein [Vicinamibacterales bacterium]